MSDCLIGIGQTGYSKLIPANVTKFSEICMCGNSPSSLYFSKVILI